MLILEEINSKPATAVRITEDWAGSGRNMETGYL